MQKIRVSVLVPAFQAEQTLQRALESVLACEGAEAIVAPDDGSNKYAALAAGSPERVKVLPPTHRQGPGATRNRAYAASRGEFIFMLDSDDVLEPGALDEALDLASSNPAGVAFVRTKYVWETGGLPCRELAYNAQITFSEFVAFNGSIHALCRRALWRPYAVKEVAEDVIHDAEILIDSGMTAPLTGRAYLLMLHTGSLTSLADQTEFNTGYLRIADAAPHPALRQLFLEKSQVGESYLKARAGNSSLHFQDFMRMQQRADTA
jgi:glycosyltransferase involved in cell wall biosynthesis